MGSYAPPPRRCSPKWPRAVPRRPHRIRQLAGMPRLRTQTDHSGRTQRIHPLMRLVPRAKTMHQGTHPDSREHRLPGRDPLAPAAQTVWIPRANHQRPGRGDGQCRARSRNFGRPAADPIRPRCRSARAPRQHTVLSPSRARPRCGGNRCRLRGRWARRRDRGDRRRSGCRS